MEWVNGADAVATRAALSKDSSAVIVEHAIILASPARQLHYALEVAARLTGPKATWLTLAEVMLILSFMQREEYFALHYLQNLRLESSLIGLRAEIGADIGSSLTPTISLPAVARIQERVRDAIAPWGDEDGVGAVFARAIALAVDDRCHETFAAAKDEKRLGASPTASEAEYLADRYPHSELNSTPHLLLTPSDRAWESEVVARPESTSSAQSLSGVVDIFVAQGTVTPSGILRQLEKQGESLYPGELSRVLSTLLGSAVIEAVRAPSGRDQRERYFRLTSIDLPQTSDRIE